MKYVVVRVSFVLAVVVLWASLTTAAVQSVVNDTGTGRGSTPCQTNDDCAGYVCSPLGICLGNVPSDATVDAGLADSSFVAVDSGASRGSTPCQTNDDCDAGLATSQGSDGSNGVDTVHGALVGMLMSLCTLAFV